MIQCVEQRNDGAALLQPRVLHDGRQERPAVAGAVSRRPGSSSSIATCGPTASARRPIARPARKASCSSATSRSSRRNWKSTAVCRLRVREPALGRDLELDAGPGGAGRADGAAGDRQELSELLRVPLNADGFFLEAHMKLRPVDFASEGCSCAARPTRRSSSARRSPRPTPWPAGRRRSCRGRRCPSAARSPGSIRTSASPA